MKLQLGYQRLDQINVAQIIGEEVSIGSGAAILRLLRVGDGSAIGANAVVLCDVPAGAFAVGSPAMIMLRKNTSADKLARRSDGSGSIIFALN